MVAKTAIYLTVGVFFQIALVAGSLVITDWIAQALGARPWSVAAVLSGLLVACSLIVLMAQARRGKTSLLP